MNYNFDPTNFERHWLRRSLERFHRDGWIKDILYRVKSGKEATVYCCQAGPAAELDLVAAKVYHHRRKRAMQNRAAYQQGRDLLGAGGSVMRDQRQLRAIRKKSKYGQRLETISWLEHEFQAMRQLHAAGADLPRPLIQGATAFLMEYIGDATQAAPLLQEIALTTGQAWKSYRRLLRNIELFLAHDRVHGDLSAYNALYWEDRIYIIDFPQIVDAVENPDALPLLTRDVVRLYQYFARCGVKGRPVQLAQRLWQRYHRGELSHSAEPS